MHRSELETSLVNDDALDELRARLDAHEASLDKLSTAVVELSIAMHGAFAVLTAGVDRIQAIVLDMTEHETSTLNGD